MLMEEDMFEQLNCSVDAVSQNVPQALSNFHLRADNRPDYRHLMMKPDLFYLALTQPHMRVKTIPAPVRQPRPNLTSNTTTAVSSSAPVMRQSLRPVRPVRAVRPASTLNNVPIFRLQGQRQQTLRLLRPANPPASHVRQGLTSPPLRQTLITSFNPGTSPSPRLVLRTPAPTLPQPQSQPSQPIIVSVASLAASSTKVSPSTTDQFVCPGFPYKCKDGGLKTRSNLIQHWTMDHFYNNIDRTVYGLQQKLE